METENTQPQAEGTLAQEKKWHTPLTTVTVLSKVLAGLVFITLPFIGFWWGMQYGETTHVEEQVVLPIQTTATESKSPEVKSKQTLSPEVAVDGISLVSPVGGEVLSAGVPVEIVYNVEPNFTLKDTEKGELYLMDGYGLLVGYIGDFETTQEKYVWDTKKLLHNAGMDFTVSATSPGMYKIVMLVRPKHKPRCTDCGPGVDTVDGYAFTDGKLFYQGTLAPVEAQPTLSDVSDGFFSIK